MRKNMRSGSRPVGYKGFRQGPGGHTTNAAMAQKYRAPMMTRGGFLRGAGIAGAGVAAAGLGMSGVAHAVPPAEYHHVNPTGIASTDYNAIQTAVNNYDRVYLEAKNTSNQYTAFNLSGYSIDLPENVEIMGEKLGGAPVAKEWDSNNTSYNQPFVTPAGPLMSDRTVVYSGGAENPPYYFPNMYKGVFDMSDSEEELKNLTIKNIRFDSSRCASIVVRICGELVISDNVITNVIPGDYGFGEPQAEGKTRPFAFGIDIHEVSAYWEGWGWPHPHSEIGGPITIEDNYMDVLGSEDSQIPSILQLSGGIGLHDIHTDTGKESLAHLKNNTVKNAANSGLYLPGMGGTLWVEKNKIFQRQYFYTGADDPHAPWVDGMGISPHYIVPEWGWYSLTGMAYVCDNKMYDVAGDGIGLFAVENAVVKGNLIHKVPRYEGYRSAEWATAGIWVAEAIFDPEYKDCKNNTIQSNKVTGTGDYGICGVGIFDNVFLANNIQQFTPGDWMVTPVPGMYVPTGHYTFGPFTHNNVVVGTNPIVGNMIVVDFSFVGGGGQIQNYYTGLQNMQGLTHEMGSAVSQAVKRKQAFTRPTI